MTPEELKAFIKSNLESVVSSKKADLQDFGYDLVDFSCYNIDKELDGLIDLLSNEEWMRKNINKASRWTRRKLRNLKNKLKEFFG